jgi:hypothetical protein
LPCLPPKKVKRVEIWGGLTSIVGVPPQKNQAENFLLVDDITFEGETVPPIEDLDPPQITILDAPTTVDREIVDVHLLVEERGPPESQRLASVDRRVVHESGEVIDEFTGGVICGGPGSSRECPLTRLDEVVSIGLSLVLEGRYTITFRACDAAGNCSPSTSRDVVLDLAEPPPPPRVWPLGVEVNQSVQETIFRVDGPGTFRDVASLS